MTAPKAITPSAAEQTPGVVMLALAEVHCRRLQEMLDGAQPLPPGRSSLDVMTALRGWRGILRAAEEAR